MTQASQYIRGKGKAGANVSLIPIDSNTQPRESVYVDNTTPTQFMTWIYNTQSITDGLIKLCEQVLVSDSALQDESAKPAESMTKVNS